MTDDPPAELGAAETARVTAVAETRVLQHGSASTSLVGQIVDGFAIDSILGGGAFGTVYRGTQLGLERAVAFKVPTLEMAGDEVAARRFEREARAAASVDHPGVVTIYAVGELPDGRPYIAMQFVDGRPLDRILEGEAKQPIDPVRALRIARLVASALSETHAASVVHRDLKPSNIIWRTDRNGDDRITVVDFGIAVCKPGNAETTRLTGTNLLGTPHYMSPEQAQGDDVDGRADLYALGCVLVELVTGAPPFAGSGFEVLLAHINKAAPVPSQITPGVPASVDRLVAQLLGKKAEERPQSAAEVIKLIDRALAELAAATVGISVPAVAPPAPPKPRSRGQRLAIGITMLVALAGATFVGSRLGSAPSTTPATPADPIVADDPAPIATHELTADDGTFVCRVTMPVALHPKTPIRMRVRVLTKFGAPIDATDVVVTFGDESGAAQGVTAKRRQNSVGSGSGTDTFFSLRTTFAAPGRYVMRVFPPDSDSVFKFDLDAN